MNTDSFFEEVSLGRLHLANRIVMAPMTRSRADENDCPTDLHVEYYRQRACAGLMITEGTQPSKNGKGYCRTPGIYSRQQVEAWKKVTDAVHEEGGKIALQIMHCGRIAHPDNKAPDAETVAPSAIRAKAKMFTPSGMAEMPVPRALNTDEVMCVVDEYRQATEYAYAAGFDGIELHCSSGYLPAQFLSSGTNRRQDQYGGNTENRLRFVLQVVEAMSVVDGPDRLGVRICPGLTYNDLHDDDPERTFAALLQHLDQSGLAYLHVNRLPDGPIDNIALARQYFSGPLIINDGYNLKKIEAETGIASALSFGRPFIANPDLVYRLQHNIPLADFDPKTLYTPGARGYTDYPQYS